MSNKEIWIMIVGVVLICFVVYFVVRGKEGIKLDVKKLTASHMGIERKITLYAVDGSIIKSWCGNYKVGIDETGVRFLDNGRVINIFGTFVVEEIKKIKKNDGNRE